MLHALERRSSLQCWRALLCCPRRNCSVATPSAAILTCLPASPVPARPALPSPILSAGGGHVNHSIFWSNLAPAGKGGGGEPTGDLKAAIDAKWGSFAAFKTALAASAVGVQGSGWAWLGYNKATKGVEIATCANQDPLSITGLTPLLGIDVWEHAYYLQYKNMRADYLSAIWSVVNFGDVAKRLEDAKKA